MQMFCGLSRAGGFTHERGFLLTNGMQRGKKLRMDFVVYEIPHQFIAVLIQRN